MALNSACMAFWRQFLTQTGRPQDTPLYECFHFDLNEQFASELLTLVLSGQKKATSSSLFAYEAEGSHPPAVGSLSIVTDFAGNPACVVETKAITHLRFADMTFDICKREGEDTCLETWRRTHIRFFTQEGAQLGYAFTEDMPVVFEDFELVYPT